MNTRGKREAKTAKREQETIDAALLIVLSSSPPNHIKFQPNRLSLSLSACGHLHLSPILIFLKKTATGSLPSHATLSSPCIGSTVHVLATFHISGDQLLICSSPSMYCTPVWPAAKWPRQRTGSRFQNTRLGWIDVWWDKWQQWWSQLEK